MITVSALARDLAYYRNERRKRDRFFFRWQLYLHYSSVVPERIYVDLAVMLAVGNCDPRLFDRATRRIGICKRRVEIGFRYFAFVLYRRTGRYSRFNRFEKVRVVASHHAADPCGYARIVGREIDLRDIRGKCAVVR